MNCVTQNIHMDVLRCKIESQFTLEQDCNLADSKPDLTHILLSDGFIKLEETRPGDGKLTIRGKFHYRLLYASEDCFGKLNSLQGKIPFEETLHVNDMTVSDSPQISIELEHLQIHPINSRKINIRAILLVNGCTEDISDALLCHDIEDSKEKIELHHNPLEALNLCVMKKDICRIREEIKLPSGMPNISEILWEQTQLGNLSFHTYEDKLLLKGDLSVLIMYLADDERDSVECFETTVPFQSELECTGCKEGLLTHIAYSVCQKHFDILPDIDGLERIIGAELALDLSIKLFEELKLTLIDDLYGTQNEIIPFYDTYSIKKLISNTSAQMILDKETTLNHTDNILQVKCTKATLCPEHCKPTADGIEVEGYLSLQILLLTDDDHFPYRTQKSEIPFSYCINLASYHEDMIFELSANLESCQVTPVSGDSFDVKSRVAFDVFAYVVDKKPSLSRVESVPYSKETIDRLSGITLYYIQEGASLWEIGKDSLTSLQTIREHNALLTDSLTPGQKLLVMR